MISALAIAVLTLGALANVDCVRSSDAPLDGQPRMRAAAQSLIWADEFEGPQGTRPDPRNWQFETGYGWGDGELQAYTDRPDNTALDGQGHLAITARPEQYTLPDGTTANYTSARLNTHGRFEFAYGRVSARIRVPAGRGLLPAFWAVGSNLYAVGWPESGEFDVVEVNGADPFTLHGVIHGPREGHHHYSVYARRRSPAPLSDAFHVYGVEWSPHRISFSLDGTTYAVRTPASLPSGSQWVFEHPFFLVLTLAVGPRWMDRPDTTTPWPATMLVDWIRVHAFRKTFFPTVRGRRVRRRCPRRRRNAIPARPRAGG
jgi:beta-glucanase (GH16 family)